MLRLAAPASLPSPRPCGRHEAAHGLAWAWAVPQLDAGWPGAAEVFVPGLAVPVWRSRSGGPGLAAGCSPGAATLRCTSVRQSLNGCKFRLPGCTTSRSSKAPPVKLAAQSAGNLDAPVAGQPEVVPRKAAARSRWTPRCRRARWQRRGQRRVSREGGARPVGSAPDRRRGDSQAAAAGAGRVVAGGANTRAAPAAARPGGAVSAAPSRGLPQPAPPTRAPSGSAPPDASGCRSRRSCARVPGTCAAAGSGR